MFVVGGRAFESTRLRNRISSGLSAEAARRVVFMPFLPRAALLRVMSACDLMLDTVHWSGGNTTLDALRAGLPVLSSRGRFMRSRQSAAMLDRIGLGSLLVTAPAALAERAIGLLADDARDDARAQIATRFDDLVAGSDALAQLRDAVWQALQPTHAAPLHATGTADAR
jgi:predicted O-linked N-acetylglucosamine transferase (SPINDLY family)